MSQSSITNEGALMRGRIIKIVSNQYTVLIDDNIVECVAMGKVRLQKTPVVGDFVEAEQLDGQIGIQKILPRTNELIRPAIANVDQVLLVMSAKEPEFSSQLVDRLLFLIHHAGIQPILVITKMDLAKDDSNLEVQIKDYQKSGYQVICVDKSNVASQLPQYLKDKVTVLTGQSGVGKSTILNQINPEFKIHTQAISKALGRGKHTTRHTELHKVADGWVADTPGFSSLDFNNLSLEDLRDSVMEFNAHKEGCRFRNCMHLEEPGCAVKEAIEKNTCSKIRYQHYLEVIYLIKNKKERYL